MTIVYLWAAGTAQGVADDDARARRRAEAAMIENGSRTAAVTTAHCAGLSSLDGGYTDWGGLRWDACRSGDLVCWTRRWVAAPAQAAAHGAAS